MEFHLQLFHFTTQQLLLSRELLAVGARIFTLMRAQLCFVLADDFIQHEKKMFFKPFWKLNSQAEKL